MNNITQTSEDVAYFMGLLWVLGLMLACVVAYIGNKRTNNLYGNPKQRRVGFEIETVDPTYDVNRSRLAQWLTRKFGLRTEDMNYTHEVVEHTKLVTDGSLSGGTGVEIVSPPLHQHEIRSYLSKLTSGIRGIMGVNRSTGLHVHVEIIGDEQDGSNIGDESRVVGAVAVAYGYFQDAINKMVSRSRRNNGSYCGEMGYAYNYFKAYRSGGLAFERMPLRDALKNVFNIMHDYDYHRMSEHRYQAVNPTSLRKYGTVEFRQHQGTTNPTKIDAWSQFVILLTERCTDFTSLETLTNFKRDDIGQMFRWIGLSPQASLVRYYKKRSQVLETGVVTGVNGQCKTCNSNRCAGDCVTQESYSVDDLREWATNEYGMMGFVGLLFSLSPLVVAIALIVGCGIGAIHNAGAKKFKHKNRAVALWNKLAIRGGQASGVAWRDGQGKLWFIKSPVSSRQLSHNLRKQLDEDASVVIMHTRYATHGVNNKANAHPHWSSCNRICLVHNGVVHNHDDVWKALGRKPTGDVDSMAVAEALAVGGIEEVVKHCEGSMSLIWLDRDHEHDLKFWTNGGNPLAFGRLDHKTKGAVVVASTMDILKSTMGKRLKSAYECVVGREYTVTKDGSITSRDIEGSEATARTFYDWRTWSRGSYYDDWQPTKPLKATGNADNCSLPAKTTSVEYPEDDMPNEDVIHFWTEILRATVNGIYDWQPWKSIVDEKVTYHGYDGFTNEGIRPDGTMYECPHVVQYEHASSPVLERLLYGHYDPLTAEV
jgi:hypothetical protein